LYDVVLHVGVTSEPRRLFRYYPSPIVMTQDGKQVALLVEPQRRLLVHSINSHQELEENDLNECQRRRNTYVCSGPTAFHTQLRRSCLGSLFSADLASVREHCPLHQTNISWTAQSLGNDQVAVYFRDRTTLQTICPGDIRHNQAVQGHQVLHLPANCSLTGLDLRISGRTDILLQAPVATHPEWNSAELLDNRTPVEILQIRERLQQHNISPHPDIKRMLQQEAADREEEEEEEHTGHHHYVLYVIGALVTGAVIGVIWRYGRLLTMAAAKSYSELKTLREPPRQQEG